MLSATSFLLKNQALRYPVFRYFLLVRVAIILALNMQSAIVAYYVYQLTHDKLALGMLGLWEVIPAVGFSLISGHFVDLNEKRTMMASCIGLYILLSGLFIGLAWPGIQAHFSVTAIVWLVYAGIFIGGALRAFLGPSSFALQGLLTPREHYPNATTWSSTSWHMGAVIGPLLGGFMILFGFNVSLVWVAVIELVALIALLRIPRQQIMKKEKEPIMKSITEGLRFVFRSQLVLAVLSLDMFAVLFGGAVALLPVYADDILKVGEVGFGWMRAAPGIGSVVCLFILSLVPLKTNPGIKLMASIAAFGVTTIVFAYSGYFGTDALFSVGSFGVSMGFLVAFSMLFLGGFFDAVNVVIRHTILQVHTPDEMRGRVAAVNTMFISSSNELGAMESGLTARWMGTVPAVVVGGCLTIATVAVTWFAAPMLRVLRSHEEKHG